MQPLEGPGEEDAADEPPAGYRLFDEAHVSEDDQSEDEDHCDAADQSDGEDEDFDSAQQTGEGSHAVAGTTTNTFPADEGFGSFVGGFDNDGFTDLPPDAFSSTTSTNFPETPAPRAAISGGPLSPDDVAIIRDTMAALDIRPPPWVQKMQQMQRIQLALQAAGPSAVPEDAAVAAANADPARMQEQWAAAARVAAGPGSHLLPASTLASASPLLPASGGANAGGVPMVPGLAPARKRVTGKQLAAERRRLREEQRAKAAQEPAAAS